MHDADIYQILSNGVAFTDNSAQILGHSDTGSSVPDWAGISWLAPGAATFCARPRN